MLPLTCWSFLTSICTSYTTGPEPLTFIHLHVSQNLYNQQALYPSKKKPSKSTKQSAKPSNHPSIQRGAKNASRRYSKFPFTIFILYLPLIYLASESESIQTIKSTNTYSSLISLSPDRSAAYAYERAEWKKSRRPLAIVGWLVSFWTRTG